MVLCDDLPALPVMPGMFRVHIAPLLIVVKERAVEDALIPIRESCPKLFMSFFPEICVYLHPAALIRELRRTAEYVIVTIHDHFSLSNVSVA